MIFIEVEKSFGFRIFFLFAIVVFQISLFLQNLFFFVLSLKHFGCFCHYFGLLGYIQMEEVLYFILFCIFFWPRAALAAVLKFFSLHS